MTGREVGRAPTAPAAEPGGRRTGGSRHGPIAQLLIAWSPLSMILLAYAAAQWVSAPLGPRGHGATANRLGFGVHVTGPAGADRGVFGTVPSVWLQARLVAGSAHWYDAAAALVYVTHFVSFPLLTGVVWFYLRERFAAWVTAVLTFTTLGAAVYCVYPAAPPWLASARGAIGPVDRLSSRGWDYLHLGVLGRLTVSGQGGSNPVAAMPSLHAGSAMLVALFLWPLANALSRAALVGYVVLMALALVYTGEHYAVDVAAGWLTAAVGAAAGVAVRDAGRRSRSRRPPRGSGSDLDRPVSVSQR